MFDAFRQKMLPAIEKELKANIDRIKDPRHAPLREMLAYHMGWIGEGAGPRAQGKRIRPLLTLLTAAAAGGNWENALPAAAAVELVHNFSLIHDDIEDKSPQRRGRPTIWALWGIPQAVNAGDALFTIAYLALLRLEQTTTPQIALKAMGIMQDTCLQLTEGQYLDIAYEKQNDLTVDDYWPMVSGKTAALLAACTEIGALAGGASPETQAAYRRLGLSLGLAFQALDDLLGIWGDAALTGKSASSDLISGKKSLPVVFALSQNGEFARRWREGPIQSEEVEELARQLEIEGAQTFAQEAANRETQKALAALDQAAPAGDAGMGLRELARFLLNRRT